MRTQTNKQQAASQRIKLARIKREIVVMSANWEDRNNFIASVLDGLADEVEKVIGELDTDLIPTTY